MFENGQATGQLRIVYTDNKYEDDAQEETSSTAVGGKIKYELAKLNGFNAAFTMRYSEDIDKISSDNRDEGLSSSEGVYSQLSEAYMAYKDDALDIKAGRQVMDTPLADSDDIRMVQNSFEALRVRYTKNNTTLDLGYLNKWQGFDAGLDDGWVNTGEKGSSFVGLQYSDNIDAQVWYYNIEGGEYANQSIYSALSYKHDFSKYLSVFGAIQYLNQRENAQSGIKSDIYGAMVELITYNIGFNFAYNRSSKHSGKKSFSGFGGGALFTNMDTMILDEIADDRDAEAFVAGLSYEINNFAFLCAYGTYEGDKNSLNDEEDIKELNSGVEYNFNDEFVAYFIYVKNDDLSHVRLMANYNF
jgi:hypothetical protein